MIDVSVTCVRLLPCQYMSAVWPQNEKQAAIAKKVAKECRKEDVPILPAAPFYDAEDYHQKYYEKQTTSLPRVCRRPKK